MVQLKFGLANFEAENKIVKAFQEITILLVQS